MPSHVELANSAWESLYRAQATILRRFADSELWSDVQPSEYGVLYSLAAARGGKRMSDLHDDALLTQPGLSRLIQRLESRGLVEREADPRDGRAALIRLTPAGARLQRRIGGAHARQIDEATLCLSTEQLQLLCELCTALIDSNQRRNH